ncbi:unnamed protein product [Rodentolepis nana]|uniref:XK-related protein n=1 Tax=Rodentolepis nana TaxID=102285 RepID=A0A0R3T488_RODNA|nr:unnamed protein product [Rodentolepis nana]
MKIIPKVLRWWRSKDRCQSHSHNPIGQSRLFILVPIVTVLLRIITTFIWLYISFPFVINLVDKHLCSLDSSNSLCQHIDFFKSQFMHSAVLLLRLKIVCLVSHLSQLLLQSFRVSTNPFFTLLDAIFFVLSANLIVGDQKVFSSIFPSIFIVSLVSIAGIGVLVYSWLPYAQEDLNEQKERLRAAWPASTAHSSSYYSTSSLNVNSMSDAASLSLDSLSLDNKTPHSAIFSPPTSTSFFHQNHVYAASAAPAYSYLREVGSASSPLAYGDFDAKSHFTSISQVSKLSKREKRRRRHRQPTGLLRWALYLLFGRLETWSDVKSELVCILNAVLVGVLLVLICQLFYIVMPVIWSINV